MRTRIAAVVLCLAFAVPASAISNSSFETFTGTFTGDGCRQLLAGATTMTDWTSVGSEIAICGTPNAYLITAADGANFLDIAGYTNGTGRGVSQTLTGLVVGQQYVFTADLGISNNPSCVPGATCGGPISVLVTIGSAASETLSHNSAAAGVQWATYGFSFIANSTTATLSIVGSALPAGGAFIGLDNVTLAVPEPAVASLALIAIGALGVARTRRR